MLSVGRTCQHNGQVGSLAIWHLGGSVLSDLHIFVSSWHEMVNLGVSVSLR